MEYILSGGFLSNGDYKDIHIKEGKIVGVLEPSTYNDIKVVDVKDKLIIPGLVDVHVHLRTPGYEHKEDLTTGSMAAKKGGYTQVFAMPNTKPVLDNVDMLKELNKMCEDSDIKISHYGSITKKFGDDELTDFKEMSKHCVGFTNDGVGVQKTSTMYEAMIKAKEVNMPIVAHCEDESLIYGGCMHEGIQNKNLGLKGILSISESIQVQRDIDLSKETNCKYHVCHVSTKESVEAIYEAKQKGLDVSGEVTPHHLLLTESDVVDPNFKMNPPLRSTEDLEALRWAIKNDVLEIIATDHAPHTKEEKDTTIDKAPFGIIGLEHAFSLCYTYLVKKDIISLEKLVKLMSYNPRKRFDLEKGLIEGDLADVCVIDLNKKEIISEENIVSKSKNSPFIGKEIYGITNMTIVDGVIVYENK